MEIRIIEVLLYLIVKFDYMCISVQVRVCLISESCSQNYRALEYTLGSSL